MKEPDTPASPSGTISRAHLIAGVWREIEASLKARNLADALELTQQFVCPPATLPRWSQRLEAVFKKEGRLGDLVEFFWARRGTLLPDMFAVGLFMKLCRKAECYERFRVPLDDWLRANPAPARSSSEFAHLHRFTDLARGQKIDFCRIKYREWPELKGVPSLCAIEAFAECTRISPSVAKYLFDRRSDRQIPYPRWLEGLTRSEAIKHVCMDSQALAGLRTAQFDPRQIVGYPNFDELVDAGAARSFFASLEAPNGLLLVTLHGAHTYFAIECFKRIVRDGIVMTRAGTSSSNRIGVDSGRHAAGFRAFKALREGKVLLMAADVPARQSVTVSVMGLPIDLADGAPMIAYEARCGTVFYTMIRDGDRFVPRFETGPVPDRTEAFPQFRERWFAFYAAQVEQIFRGDPGSITLAHFWPLRFQQFYDCLPSPVTSGKRREAPQSAAP